ncbi:MAG: hypothetical protein J5814_08115 [Bacteroidaceae bacterium]|nr:hypothetical protein [Bacteroidaceae bacterium]
MKKSLVSLLVAGLVFLPLTGKNDSSTRQQLVDIRSYVSADPPRALHELEAIDAASLSEGDAALYAVLLTQAADKCLITHTSDSLILTAVDYYSHAGRDKELRALAQFYLGSVCRDLGDDFRAVEAYLPAADAFRRQNDLVMLRRTSQNIADHLFRQHLFDESSSWYRQAYDAAVSVGDSLRMIMPLEGIAKCAMALGHYEQSYDDYLTLLSLSRAIGNPVGTALAAEQLSLLTRWRGNVDSALAYASLAESLREGEEKLFPYYLKGQAFSALGIADSASYYLRLCQGATDNDNLEASATSALASLDSLSGHFESAYTHMQHYAELKGSLSSSVDRLRMTDVLRNYQESVARATHTRRLLIGIAAALLLAGVLTSLLLIRRRRNKERENDTLLFEEQLGACINQFMQSPWNDELSAIHHSRTRGHDAFAPEHATALQQDLFRLFRPVVDELRTRAPQLTDAEISSLLLCRLGFSTYTQSICLNVSDNTVRSYKHRLRSKLQEPYLSIFKL